MMCGQSQDLCLRPLYVNPSGDNLGSILYDMHGKPYVPLC